MANDKQPRVRLITPPFRASFPNVFEKRAFEGQGEDSARYACGALFQGFEVINGVTSFKAPADWAEKDRLKWNALIKACNDVAVAAFKRPMKELMQIGGYKLPFHRGEEKEYDGYGPGVVYFTMSAKNRRPQIIAKDGSPITQSSVDEFYAGCWARATVSPFANTKWKTLSFGLNNLQKLGDAPRLDMFSSAEDDFGSDPAEFDDGADDGEAAASEDFA